MTNRIPFRVIESWMIAPLMKAFWAILLACAVLEASAAEPPAPTPEVQEAERAARLAAAGLAFAGNWHTTEVIVFERTHVDAASYGEGLLVDRARRYPGRMRSLDVPGTGSVYYPPDRDALECLRVVPGSPPAAGPSAVPEAFTRPAAGPRPDSGAADVASAAAEQEPAGAGAAPPAAPPDPLVELRESVRRYEETLTDQSLVWLPPESRTLSQQAARLAGSGYRVLFHEAWVQNLASNAVPASILIQTGLIEAGLMQADNAAAATAELEGILQFGGNRGTRFEAELWYRPPGGDTPPGQYVELRETRQLGDGEFHYLDHPKLGVLVRTTSVALPADVVQAFEALSPSGAESSGAAAPSAPLPPR